jgi:hypothetical protein
MERRHQFRLEGSLQQRLALVAHLLKSCSPRARADLVQVQEWLEDVQINQQRDGFPPGDPENPELCERLKQDPEAEAWWSVVRFDGWGSPLPITADPLQEPIRAREAGLVIAGARASLTRPKSKE